MQRKINDMRVRVSSTYKNTHYEVYIQPMCKGAHVRVEHRYLCVSPTLNVLRSGGSKVSHLSTWAYLSLKVNTLTRFDLGNY